MSTCWGPERRGSHTLEIYTTPFLKDHSFWPWRLGCFGALRQESQSWATGNVTVPPQERGAGSEWSHLQQNWFSWSSLWVEPGKETAARRRKNGLPIFSCVQRKSIQTMDLEGPGPLAVLAPGGRGGSVAWGRCWDLPLLKQFPAYKVAARVESPLRRGYANEWVLGVFKLSKVFNLQ